MIKTKYYQNNDWVYIPKTVETSLSSSLLKLKHVSSKWWLHELIFDAGLFLKCLCTFKLIRKFKCFPCKTLFLVLETSYLKTLLGLQLFHIKLIILSSKLLVPEYFRYSTWNTWGSEIHGLTIVFLKTKVMNFFIYNNLTPIFF